MIYTQRIQKAILFAIKTHEIDEKQKRKGKDIPYITHPLTVGLILSSAGASEDVVIAGILHDTIEDSIKENKVTREMIVEQFGEGVAELVLSVTEQDKSLSWEERKKEALEHIKTFSNDSLLVKSADIVSNITETIDDYQKNGEEIFKNFSRPKEQMLRGQINAMEAILERWPGNPLAEDVKKILGEIKSMAENTEMKPFTIKNN